MEKIWIYCAGLFATFALVHSGLEAAERVEKVKVEVEVPVENGDEASALDIAQKRAFEKAYAKTLSARLDPESREKKIRQAASFVRSFELIQKKVVGTNLQVTYVVDVSVGSASTRGSDPYQYAQYFEIVWNSTKQKVSSADLSRHLKKSNSADLQTLKMTGGSWWLAVSSRQSPNSIRQSIQSFISNRGQVRLSEFDTQTSSDLRIE